MAPSKLKNNDLARSLKAVRLANKRLDSVRKSLIKEGYGYEGRRVLEAQTILGDIV